MKYDASFWDAYTLENESRYNELFATMIRECAGDDCSSILEAGCGTGIDLRLVDSSRVPVYGVDIHLGALHLARHGLPHATFISADITSLPFEDNSIDTILTHQVLNYLDDHTLEAAMSELYRVAERHILSCELNGPDGQYIRGHYRYRDMVSRWSRYGRIIYRHLLPPVLDPCQTTALLIEIDD